MSWYGSSDVNPDGKMGSILGDGTALGIGFKHRMPKAKVEIIAAVQQYTADLTDESEMDDTVAVIGSRIMF